MPFVELHSGDAKRRLTKAVMTVRTCPKCGRSNLMTIQEWRERVGLSAVTAWRLMKRGNCPHRQSADMK